MRVGAFYAEGSPGRLRSRPFLFGSSKRQRKKLPSSNRPAAPANRTMQDDRLADCFIVDFALYHNNVTAN